MNTAIAEVGLEQGVDEYKSGYRMAGQPSRHALRDRIFGLVLEKCRIGIYIASVEERPNLREPICRVIDTLIRANNLPQRQTVYVDEGISGRSPATETALFIWDCDSRLHPGIQMADLVAYHCSYLLKCELEGHSKKVTISEVPHPMSGEETELNWIVRTDLRRSFFVLPRNVDDIQGDDWFFRVADYGLFLSPRLPADLKAAANRTFGEMYLGCVW